MSLLVLRLVLIFAWAFLGGYLRSFCLPNLRRIVCNETEKRKTKTAKANRKAVKTNK